MVGTTLVEIRDHIETLAGETGEYYLVCARYGDRPVPAAGLRFERRGTARAAVKATEQYRAALRRYDPQLPYYDVIVCQDTRPLPSTSRVTDVTRETDRRTLSEPVLDTVRSTHTHQNLIEFCHRVAGAVFETLSEGGYDSVESAVMEAYFELAETVGDPDELCVCLLESMSGELDERLSPADQAEVLADAATRLESPTDDHNPLDTTLEALEQRGFIESYARSPFSVDIDGGVGAVVVQIAGYALSARNDRLPVLPVTLELCRHHTEHPPRSIQVTAVDGGWQLTFVLANAGEQNGLVSAPIDRGV
ncbi:DUF7551 domain-containing protein [Halomarina ordinaria]|uniref:Uncharacterized protein n=1 Tax=Halomarina ordinaria TaxID=3033939 RepID=A0ABD5UBZ1_9EURY|nr:hypothetical protein [Halomarina sp. PSRA2]